MDASIQLVDLLQGPRKFKLDACITVRLSVFLPRINGFLGHYGGTALLDLRLTGPRIHQHNFVGAHLIGEHQRKKNQQEQSAHDEYDSFFCFHFKGDKSIFRGIKRHLTASTEQTISALLKIHLIALGIHPNEDDLTINRTEIVSLGIN